MTTSMTWKQFRHQFDLRLLKALVTTDLSMLSKLNERLCYEYKESNLPIALGFRRWILELSEYAYDSQL